MRELSVYVTGIAAFVEDYRRVVAVDASHPITMTVAGERGQSNQVTVPGHFPYLRMPFDHIEDPENYAISHDWDTSAAPGVFPDPEGDNIQPSLLKFLHYQEVVLPDSTTPASVDMTPLNATGLPIKNQDDASVLELLHRAVERSDKKTKERVRSLVQRFKTRHLFKRACVFPRYENEAVQDSLVARYFAAGGSKARAEAEARITDLVRFASGKHVDVIVYCPAQKMQLKEARMHVRWPGVAKVQPLSTFTERVPRLADLERSYRDLWKFYVFADTSDPELLVKVQDAAKQEFADATNVYNASGRA